MADRTDIVKDVGIFGLKTLVTLNSGAVIVLLAFLGNTYCNKADSISIDITSIKCSMFVFLGGICAAFLSIVLTYVLAQSHEEPWVENMPSHYFLSIMMVPAFLSFAFFLWGFIRATLSFT